MRLHVNKYENIVLKSPGLNCPSTVFSQVKEFLNLKANISPPHYDYGRNGIILLIPPLKGPRPTTSVISTKRGGKRARQCDPNKPQKPVSGYALFLRDVQAGIKQRYVWFLMR